MRWPIVMKKEYQTTTPIPKKVRADHLHPYLRQSHLTPQEGADIGNGQQIPHLFGPGTNVSVLIGPIFFGVSFCPIGGISERHAKPAEIDY